MTAAVPEDRKQSSEKVLHSPVLAICLLSSDLCHLFTDL
jgi:hypothetical protein